MAKILLIDDDPNIRDMYSERIRAAGYDITTVANGTDGLAEAQKKPDLILLDIMMPGMNGLDVLRQIKNNPELEDIPVILLTALIRELKEAKSIRGGAQGYFVKSDIVPGQMVKEINAVLAKKQSSESKNLPQRKKKAA